MNFKIEINYMSITNYPYLEEHFKKKAGEGWLISKIIASGIFIYKRIEAQDLDFSISPYEAETSFTRKTKADLKEFHTVSKYIGWNFIEKTSDLHIYYKNNHDQASPLETDEEETFKTLELIAKRHKRYYYFLSFY